jgi:hypothetical protein
MRLNRMGTAMLRKRLSVHKLHGGVAYQLSE